MFKHYESEQDTKRRELMKSQGIDPKSGGPDRSRGFGGRRGGATYVWTYKNSTVYIPLNTMWLKFRSATGTNSLPDPRLSQITMKIRDVNQLEESIQQARNVLMMTH